MTLAAYKSEDVKKWVHQMTQVQDHLREIIRSMDDLKMESTMLEAAKADAYIKYLVGWSDSAATKHRSNVREYSEQDVQQDRKREEIRRKNERR